jgi:16S rRNA (uracil1498-N3)-methyltransferase
LDHRTTESGSKLPHSTEDRFFPRLNHHRTRPAVLSSPPTARYPAAMHLHRFYITKAPADGAEAVLEAEEAHHALHVVRLRPGEPVALFDGHGREWLGRVARHTRREVYVSIESMRETPPPAPALTLAQAWLLRDKAIEFLILHGVELGVARFCFFRAERSERSPKTSDKWTRAAIEACKQCGRLWLPEFTVADNLEAALAGATGDRLIAAMDRTPVPLARACTGGDAVMLIGPEGDFTPAEVDAAVALGAHPVSLGATTFRAEFAAIVAATLVRYHQGGLSER